MWHLEYMWHEVAWCGHTIPWKQFIVTYRSYIDHIGFHISLWNDHSPHPSWRPGHPSWRPPRCLRGPISMCTVPPGRWNPWNHMKNRWLGIDLLLPVWWISMDDWIVRDLWYVHICTIFKIFIIQISSILFRSLQLCFNHFRPFKSQLVISRTDPSAAPEGCVTGRNIPGVIFRSGMIHHIFYPLVN